MKIYIKATIADVDIKSIKNNLFLYYGVLKTEANKYFAAYDAILDKEDETDRVLATARGKFYLKYHPFMDKCQEMVDTFNMNSIGNMSSYILIEEMLDTAKFVISTFPEEWEEYTTYAKMLA